MDLGSNKGVKEEKEKFIDVAYNLADESNDHILSYCTWMGRDMENVCLTPARTHVPGNLGEIRAHASLPPA